MASQMRGKRYIGTDEKVYKYQPKDLYLLRERYRSILEWHNEPQKKGTLEYDHSKVPEVSRGYPEAELCRSGAA